MLYQIAEHTPDRLVVRRSWDGRRDAVTSFIHSGVYLAFGTAVAAGSGGVGMPWWGRLLVFAGAVALCALSVWSGYRSWRRVEEGLYVFDKGRGVFELSHRTERESTINETYPLALVQEATAPDIGSEGYAGRLVVVLKDGRTAALHHWITYNRADVEKTSRTVNEFLGVTLAG